MKNKLSRAEAGKLGALKTNAIQKRDKEARIENYNTNPTRCAHCSNGLEYSKRMYKFCNRSCSASYNNKLTKKQSFTCVHCDTEMDTNRVYCSIPCHQSYVYEQKKQQLLDGDYGGFGTRLIKRIVTDVQGYRCSDCGISEWNNKPITLELEHKDGISANNGLDNLCLLCPNCHSQTPTYKGKNKGNGRHSRRIRYSEGKSY